MSEITVSSSKKPGIVIFIAILNFFSCAAWFFASAICLTVIVYGNAAGFYQSLTNQIKERLASQNISLGLNAVFIFFLVLSLFFLVFHFLIGLGLLKGKGAAWYTQVVAAIMGLILVPYGTVVSIVILVFFFQSNVRNFFKI